MKKKLTRLFSVLLAAVLVFGTLPVSAMGTDVADPPASAVDDTSVDVSTAEPEEEETSAVDETPDGEEVSAQSAEDEIAVQSSGAVKGYEMNIFFLDCGRKYYSVANIKKLIDNAKAAGFNYIQLAVGNDGMRFLLDDMSLTVNGTEYKSEDVKAAIHAGNEKYHDFDVDELTQSEMNEIIAYAQSKKMGVIPCVNTPGHMDAILAAATSLTGKDCSYSESARTIDVTNTTATAFTKAFLQKYIIYFSDMGCKYFNMGADEYANDIFTGGSMGFGNLQYSGKYSYYVTYVNQVAKMIENAGMTPMAFNDGIYFNNDTSDGTFDSNIVICYWSQGWSGYTSATAGYLQSRGHKLVNTNGTYYWILGGNKCTAETAKEFSYEVFAKQGSNQTQNSSLGSMFCIWADAPGELTEAQVIENSADTIAAFGSACPQVEDVTETPVDPNKVTITVGGNGTDNTLTEGTSISMCASKTVNWTASNDNVIITSADEAVASYSADAVVKAATVNVEAVKAGEVTITATDPDDEKNSASTTLTVNAKETKEILVSVGGSESITVNGKLTAGEVEDSSIATVGVENFSESTARLEEVSKIESGKQYLICNQRKKELLQGQVVSRQWGTNYYITAVEVAGSAAANSKDLWTLTGTSNEDVFTGSIVSANTNYSATNGQYLSVGENTATLSATANNDLVLTFHDEPEDKTDYWTIAQTVNGTTYYLNDFAETSAAAGWGGNGAATDDGSKWTIYEIVPAGDRTKITFNGVKEGTTTVKIGGVIYTIRVVPDELKAVDPLTIEYWVTNTQVTAGGATSKQIKATDTDVHSEAGADITSLIPEQGITDSNHNTVFKQARILDTKLANKSKSGTELQRDTGGDDDTASGYRFTKVRYWNATWQVYTTDWVDVNLTKVSVAYKDQGNNDQTYTGTQSQLVAYHMQRTTVTEEVTTDVTDWGNNVGEVNWKPYDYVELDFAVKYENGLQTPSSFPVKDATGGTNATKTMEFHAHDDTTDDAGNKYRRIGRIDTINTKDYSVYMITLTPTSDTVTDQLSTGDTDRPDSYEYKGTEKVVWVDDVDNLGKYGDKSLQAPQFRIGGEPTIDYIDIYSRQGMLVTYYVRANVTEDSLQVRYVDKTTGNLIYDYSIAVAKGTYFKDGVALNRANWKGPLDNGTVTNLQNHEIVVSADLSTMPAIAAGYRYAGYTCDSIERSEDKKVLTLYYVFNTVRSFVVDFGTPLNISLSDFNPELEAKKDEIEKVTVTDPEHSKVTYDEDTQTVVFDPDKSFVADNDGEEFSVTFAGTNPETQKDNGISYIVRVYPASNVLYEEDFLTGADGWEQSADFGSHTNAQQTQKVDDTDKNVFGYDASYAGDKENKIDPVTGQNGAWTITDLKVGARSTPLTTEFYGNTFDLIGNCDKDSGRVLLLIKEKNGKNASLTIIDTRYNDGPIYQVPLAHVVMDSETTYEVKVYASGLAATTASTPNGVATMSLNATDEETDDLIAQILNENDLTLDDVNITSTSMMDSAEADAVNVPGDAVATYAGASVEHDAGTHAEINGFRVYRSTTDDVAENYYPDNEKSVVYANILDVVKNEITAYSEVNGELKINVQQYEANGGPQNEIYLQKGQSVYFSSESLKGESIQVSLRAVKADATASVKDTQINLKSNTEMYYTLTADVDGKVTIANDGDGLLAIGNVKLPSGVSTENIQSASEAGDKAVITALKSVLYTAEEPEAFVPETFTAKTTSTPVIRNKVVTLKVNVSRDVAYITVNGVKYTRTGLQDLFQATRTIRVVNTVKKGQTKTYEIVAYNADGVASETITVTG